MGPHLIKTGLNRRSAFGYACHRCITCCRYKSIQLNPYEIDRLSARLRISTTEFIRRHTTNGGTILKFNDDGACVFLKDDGCGVHADRPLVCRLYPLGRHVDFSGAERFSLMETDDGCRGSLHRNGTVDGYLEEQGAFPFMNAADRYLELLLHVLERLKEPALDPTDRETVLTTVRTLSDRPAEHHALSWTDMDRALRDYCRETGLDIPESPEEKMALHITAIRSWMD
jgi:Fe-S-cluster containining protein